MNPRTVADIEGPWAEPNFDSGLIARCREFWTVPVSDLPNGIVATFLRQRIALPLMIAEAQRRVAAEMEDESEMFDGELREALEGASNAQPASRANRRRASRF